jgi:hypothetical protein
VAVSNANGCQAVSVPVVVAVNPGTTATFSYPAASYCQSALPVTPSVSGSSGGTFAATPAGLVLDAATGRLTPGSSLAGTFVVTYAVGGPCPSSSTATVVITAPVSAAFSYAAASYCATGTAVVTLGTGAAAGTFAATPAGLSLNATTGAIALAASLPGSYTVTNTVAAGGCAASSAAATLIVEPLPATPTLSVTSSGSTVTFTSSAAAGNQFLLNGQPIAGATGTTYVVPAPAPVGQYTVVVTSAAGCVSLPSVPQVITASRSALPANSLALYPNPTPNGYLTLSLTGPPQTWELTILNAVGQVVHQAKVAATTAPAQLDLGALPTGVYLLRVSSAAGTLSRRFVRE